MRSVKQEVYLLSVCLPGLLIKNFRSLPVMITIAVLLRNFTPLQMEMGEETRVGLLLLFLFLFRWSSSGHR